MLPAISPGSGDVDLQGEHDTRGNEHDNQPNKFRF